MPLLLLQRAGCACLLSLLAACAAVVQSPSLLTPITAQAGALPHRLATELLIEPDTGYKRTIKAGSQWLRVGTIAQGEVFMPHQDVFTLEGAHMHEAYLVVEKGVLVGFYLPAERSFSSLKRQPSISLQ